MCIRDRAYWGKLKPLTPLGITTHSSLIFSSFIIGLLRDGALVPVYWHAIVNARFLCMYYYYTDITLGALPRIRPIKCKHVNRCLDVWLQADFWQHAETGIHLRWSTDSRPRCSHPDRFSCWSNWQMPGKKPCNQEGWSSKTITTN